MYGLFAELCLFSLVYFFIDGLTFNTMVSACCTYYNTSYLLRAFPCFFFNLSWICSKETPIGHEQPSVYYFRCCFTIS
uniref:Uncharacterized protein n=1 Tax=Arundo donax TaxID=35708 RepID=A0A0A9HT72_ARUDO